jgi:hypothetical protein
LLIAMRTRSERYHQAFAILAVIDLVAYPMWAFNTVG